MRSVVVALALVLPLVALAAEASEPMVERSMIAPPGAWEWESKPSYGNVCVEGEPAPFPGPWPEADLRGMEKPMPSEPGFEPHVPCWGSIPGAQVRFRGEQQEEVRTSDEWGGLELRGLEAATYTVTATRAGFHPYEAVREVHEGFQVPLRPDHVPVQVQVVGPGGPLAGATVEAWPESPVSSFPGPATTGREGVVAFTLLAGPYRFAVSAPGHFAVDAGRFVDGSGPLRIALPAMPADFRTITGVAVDQDGDPVPGAGVQAELWDRTYEYEEALRALLPEDDDRMRDHIRFDFSTSAGEDGRFTLRVPPGPVPLSAFAPEARGAHTLLAPDQSDARLVLHRFPERSVPFQLDVTGADGAPVRSVQVEVENLEWQQWECVRTAQSEPPQATATAGPASGEGDAAQGTDDAPGNATPAEAVARMISSRAIPDGWDMGCHVVQEDEGRFTGRLMPGRTIVRVRHDPWLECYEACHDRDPAYLPFVRTVDLQPGQALDLDVVLRSADAGGATVEGYVVDAAGERGVAHAWVSFRGQPWGPYRDGGADTDGSYRLSVPPGTYEVEAYADGFLRWVGMLEVGTGTLQLDFPLVADPTWRGPCCGMMPPIPVPMPGGPSILVERPPGMYEASDVPQDGPAVAGADAPVAMAMDAERATADDGDVDATQTGGATDAALAGGLGPYDKATRAAFLAAPDGTTASGPAPESDEDETIESAPDNSIPALTVPLLVAALAGALLVRRRAA